MNPTLPAQSLESPAMAPVPPKEPVMPRPEDATATLIPSDAPAVMPIERNPEPPHIPQTVDAQPTTPEVGKIHILPANSNITPEEMHRASAKLFAQILPHMDADLVKDAHLIITNELNNPFSPNPAEIKISMTGPMIGPNFAKFSSQFATALKEHTPLGEFMKSGAATSIDHISDDAGHTRMQFHLPNLSIAQYDALINALVMDGVEAKTTQEISPTNSCGANCSCASCHPRKIESDAASPEIAPPAHASVIPASMVAAPAEHHGIAANSNLAPAHAAAL